MENKNNYKSLILNIIIFISSLVGVISSLSDGDIMMTNWKALLYYTIQSNILSAIVSLIVSVIIILIIYGKVKAMPKIVNIIKLCTTTGITLTLLVFWIFLARLLPVTYYYSLTNITLHTLSPILCIIDLFLLTEKVNMKYYLSFIEPLYYLLFALGASFLDVSFNANNDTVPYFFLDYKKLGWFKISSEGLGVCYWIVIMLGIIYLIYLTLQTINNKVNIKKENKLKNTIDYMI